MLVWDTCMFIYASKWCLIWAYTLKIHGPRSLVALEECSQQLRMNESTRHWFTEGKVELQSISSTVMPSLIVFRRCSSLLSSWVIQGLAKAVEAAAVQLPRFPATYQEFVLLDQKGLLCLLLWSLCTHGACSNHQCLWCVIMAAVCHITLLFNDFGLNRPRTVLLADFHNCVYVHMGEKQTLFRPDHCNAYTQVLLKHCLCERGGIADYCHQFWIEYFCWDVFRLEMFPESDLNLFSGVQIMWNEIRKDSASTTVLSWK